MATSLNEQINSVLNSRMSRKAQDETLIKLGLRPRDISLLRFTQRMSRTPNFTAYKLGAYTFGVEIECFNAPKTALLNQAYEKGVSMYDAGYSHHDEQVQYKIVSDCSICGNNPLECVSPVLKSTNGKESLKKVCECLNNIGAKVNKSCGLHVHFGAENLSDKHYVNVFRNYQTLEMLIDTFMPASRRNSPRYCRTMQGFNFAICRTKQDVSETLNFDRYHKVNAEAYRRHRTIEFRQHSGTCDYNKIIMWVEFLAALIEYSHDHILTAAPASIDELPFGSAKLKSYLKQRAQELN